MNKICRAPRRRTAARTTVGAPAARASGAAAAGAGAAAGGRLSLSHCIQNQDFRVPPYRYCIQYWSPPASSLRVVQLVFDPVEGILV